MSAYEGGKRDGLAGKPLDPERIAHGTSRPNAYENGWYDGITAYEKANGISS